MADPKIIYLTKSVHDLVKEYPELIPLMKELGFTRITEKTALNTLGRFMTIPKGAMMMHIDMGKVISTLLAHGFTLAVPSPRRRRRKHLLPRKLHRMKEPPESPNISAAFPPERIWKRCGQTL